MTTRKVLMSEELFQTLGATRVEWGEPDADGLYTPAAYHDAGHQLRVDAGLALLDHYETTHGVVGEHDHHCPMQTPTHRDYDKGCSCGWEAAAKALDAMDALDGRP